jgi:hypothetical protein
MRILDTRNRSAPGATQSPTEFKRLERLKLKISVPEKDDLDRSVIPDAATNRWTLGHHLAKEVPPGSTKGVLDQVDSHILILNHEVLRLRLPFSANPGGHWWGIR